MNPIVIAILCGLVAFALIRLLMARNVAKAQDEKMARAFVADPNNRTSLSVRGWKRAELEKILGDFRGTYAIPASSGWTIAANSDDVFTVSFPNDISPKLFYFLVNYLQYPRGFLLTQRAVGVLGRGVLTPAWGILEERLSGKRAEIYVPSNDEEYDQVYLCTEDGEAFEIPFTNLIWKPASEARRPQTIEGL